MSLRVTSFGGRPNKKLRFISTLRVTLPTDTSFIPNKKGEDVKGYNKFYNRKNGTPWLASFGKPDKNICNL